MDNKTDQKMEQTILEVAEMLFLEKGFALTSTTEIARVVGCNQALVHYYFRTKENLFNTIFEQKFKLFFQGVFEMNSMVELTFLEKLTKIIEWHFDMLRDNAKLPLLIITELWRRPEQVDVLRKKLEAIPEQVLEKLHAELESEIASGRIRPINLMDLVLTTVSLNISLFLLLPIASEIMGMNEEQKEYVINHRKEENVKLIIGSLKP